MTKETEESEEKLTRREDNREVERKESRERSRRYTKEQRKEFYKWTERFRKNSSEEAVPTEIPTGSYIMDQIFCIGDKIETRGRYLVGWVHPDPKKSYKPSWQLPRDIPDEELKFYKKQGNITETQYDGLLDYLEDYGLLPDGDDEDDDDEDDDDDDDDDDEVEDGDLGDVDNEEVLS